MVSRKINELQLQREQPECQRLCALTLPQWQRRALLVPSAASHPTTAVPTLLWPQSSPSQPLPLPHSSSASHSPLGLMWHHGGPEWSCAWMADAGDSTALCRPCLCHVPTNQAGSWQPHCAEHAWSQSLCPATSSQPSAPSSKGQTFQLPAMLPPRMAGPKAAPCNPR